MRLVISILALAFLAALPSGWAWARQPSPEVQRELEELRARVRELEKLKARLEALERRLGAQPGEEAPAPPSEPRPPAPPPLPPKPPSAPVRVSGFLQMRYERNEARSPKSDFLLRRARLKVQGDPASWVSVVLQAELANATVEARDAYVDLKPGSDLLLRLGQYRMPFGLEVSESSADRLAPERSRAIETLFPGGGRDRGVMVSRESAPGRGPSAALGVYNGNGLNRRDNNEAKDLVARLAQPFRWGTVGVSAYSGRFRRSVTRGDVTAEESTVRTRYGADVAARAGRTVLRAEWVTGRDLGARVEGGYLQAAYSLTRPFGIPFLRYDWYDPDRGAGRDYFSRWTLGYAHPLGTATRLTLAQELAHDSATPTGDNITTFQVQVRY